VARRRKKPIFLTRSAIKKADTNITNAGSAQQPAKFVFCETQGGARPAAGAEATITSSRTTGETCNVSDVIKYVNLFIECGPRLAATDNDEKTGWLEWAVVLVRENENEVPITNMGTLTLGNVCTNMYRGECVLTGMFPVGATQANSQAIIVKIPDHKQKLELGAEWRLVTFFRSVKTTAVDTDAVRLIRSFNYKCYT